MNKFINRSGELELLEKQFASPGASLVVLYGRRRLGKTTLLRQFAYGKPHCYFLADRAAEPDSRRALAMAMATALNEPTLANAEYATWGDLFAAFERFRQHDQNFVLILDEYQYLCQVQPAFSSFVQKFWDEHWSHSNIFLIVCGSVTSMMYKETLSHSAPLYGRSTAQMLLRPISYRHLGEFLLRKSPIQLIEFHALTGGAPRYLELATGYASFKKALFELVLKPDGILHNEAKQLLQEEIQTPNICWSVLHAIGQGANRISEIAGRVGEPANKLTRYLDLLKDLQLVRRETPVLDKNPSKSKKGIYRVSDPFCRLWFGAVYPYASFFEFGDIAVAYDKIKPIIGKLIAETFEEICRQWICERALLYNAVQIGRQWSKSYEIDVAAVDVEGNLTVIGECKWSEKQLGPAVLERLEDKTRLNALPLAMNCKRVVFSKNGFTKSFLDQAGRRDDLELVTPKQLVEVH